MPSHITRHRAWGFAACALASCFWGTGFFFGKIALRDMNSAFMVFYRFLFAILALTPLLLRHRPAFSRRDWLTLLLASFFGVPLQFLIQFFGLSLTTVSHASLMIGTMPVVLAVGATLFAHERLHLVGWLSIAASTAGATLIALTGSHTHAANGPSLTGDLLVVLSCLIALAWILLNKHLMQQHDHRTVTAWGLFTGFLMLAVYTPLAHGLPPVRHVSLAAWLALAASGVLCTATTTLLWNWGLTQVPASQAGVLLNMEPLLGSILGIALLHERLSPTAWLGGALILAAAITLTTTAPKHPDPTEVPEPL